MNRGLRIDLLLAAEPLMRRVQGIAIDRDFRKKKEGLLPSEPRPGLSRCRIAAGALRRPSAARRAASTGCLPGDALPAISNAVP